MDNLKIHADVIPMLSYEDGIGAMEWLCKVFGFTEMMRMVDDNGRLSHGQIYAGSGIIMLATPSPFYQSPKHHRKVCEIADKWYQVPYIINGVLVYVPDVESHFKKAKSLGATILSEIEYGEPGTRYRAEDPEGQRWMFMDQSFH